MTIAAFFPNLCAQVEVQSTLRRRPLSSSGAYSTTLAFPPHGILRAGGRKRSTPSSLWFQFMSLPGVQFHNMVLMILGCGFICSCQRRI